MHTMHLLPGIAIQPNLELKTPPKQLLGSLPLVIALPDLGCLSVMQWIGVDHVLVGCYENAPLKYWTRLYQFSSH